MYVLSIHTLWYTDIPDVTVNYGTQLDFIAFLGIFVHKWRAFMFEVLYLHQTFTDYRSDQYS